MWPKQPPASDKTPTLTDDIPNEQSDAPRLRVQPDTLLRRLNWTILRPLARYLGGEERSLVRGPGMDLAEIREYQPGDDVRHIDWSVTARSDRPYVREAFVERALDVWLVLDMSASVDWGTAQCLKRDRAIEFATIASQLLARNGNRIGALLFADRPLAILPPGAGRSHLLNLMSRINAVPRQASRGRTNLTEALNQAYPLLRRRSLALVVSDFLVEDGWPRALGRLAQRHEVVAVRLHDPREAEIPDVGLITFEDPETGAQLTVDTSDRKLRARFQQAAVAQAEKIRADLIGCGVDELVLSTGVDLLPTLVRFLNARKFQRPAVFNRVVE